MKVLVIGTGVIGTTYGYVLANVGHDVTHYAGSSVRATQRRQQRSIAGRHEPAQTDHPDAGEEDLGGVLGSGRRVQGEAARQRIGDGASS